MTVLIIDCGIGNIRSVARAIEYCGGKVIISDSPLDIGKCDRIILPGVGSFHDAVLALKNTGWWNKLRTEVIEKNIPLLGICLGMQLLADFGYESGKIAGLGLIPGVVKQFESSGNVRVPHVGWNEIQISKEHYIFNNIENSEDFYFVHSYYFEVSDSRFTLSKTHHGNNFCSAISNGCVTGVQFHPEKSGLAGLQLLKNFLNSSIRR